MGFQPLALEAWHSNYENSAGFNLADSSVPAVSMRELQELGADIDALLDVQLDYPEASGEQALRRRIARFYGDGVDPEQVLVTAGAAEATAIAVEALVSPGDAVVTMSPSYPQVEGMARNRGATVRRFAMVEASGWAPDLDELERVARPGTRLIGLTNPNNPTGYVLTQREQRRIVEIAESCGAWLLVDEVFRGSEHEDARETTSFAALYERAVCVNSLSKSYGLPGLRLGWAVGPTAAVEAMLRRHEYVVLAAAKLSMVLAERALEPEFRAALIKRARGLIAPARRTIEDWVADNADLVSFSPPPATPMAFVRVLTGEPSESLAHRVRREADVLVAPGAFFDVDDHLRIGHGRDPVQLRAGLDRLSAVLRS
jgi:aspartate/methionine/tyrosine aminotransferase